MTLDELKDALRLRFERSKLAYRQRDLEEFCEYWWHRLKDRHQEPNVERLARKFRERVADLIDCMDPDLEKSEPHVAKRKLPYRRQVILRDEDDS